MSEDCVFCQIIDGDIPGRTVYEDDDVFAFLDANPLSRGHTLVIPKSHHERVSDLPAGDRAAVFEALGRLAPVVEAAVDADGVTVGMNDGEAAGQEVPHVHGHLVPRFDGDSAGPIHNIFRSTADLSDEELDEVAEDIKTAIGGA
ncbi:HIT family protein [Natronomonas amylolytica]|uniref:HIT family protein n=1 Tax=Natronomonas amylolytica TaxID=3108498 RepID=UPI0030081F4E